MPSKNRLKIVPAARRSSRRAASDGPRPAGRRVFSRIEWAEFADALRLSTRELQLIQGVFDNESEDLIAAELHVSANTVHSYFKRLYRKLGVVNRVGVALCIHAEYVSASRAKASHATPVPWPAPPEGA